MTRFLNRVVRRFRPSKPSDAPILDKAVENEKARVVFCGFGERLFSGRGKVTPKRFFPVFCSTLNAAGFSTFFASTPRELAAVVQSAGLRYGLTFTYTGYPLVREMRERIASGAISASSSNS